MAGETETLSPIGVAPFEARRPMDGKVWYLAEPCFFSRGGATGRSGVACAKAGASADDVEVWPKVSASADVGVWPKISVSADDVEEEQASNGRASNVFKAGEEE